MPAPSTLVGEAFQIEVAASEPWPSDVALFQPYEVEQILLYDNAASLSVQAFLHMAQLDFSLEQRSNAEHMSPSGRVPFIRAGQFVIAELDPIITFVANKDISLTSQLDSTQKADMKAYMSLVSNVLGNAETYICWLHEPTLREVTQPRYGSVFPWPLNHILNWQKRREAIKKLSALGWHKKTLEEVYTEVEHCCQALSERLDNQPYFFDNKPTELDALVFGHLFSILTTPLPNNGLCSIVRNYKNLVTLCQNIDRGYFGSSNNSEGNFEKI